MKDIFKNWKDFPNQSKNKSKENNDSAIRLSSDLHENIKNLKTSLKDCSDIVFRDFKIAGSRDAVLIFLKVLVDTKSIDLDILKPLYQFGKTSDMASTKKLKDVLVHQVIPAAQIDSGVTFNEITERIFTGETILLVEDLSEAIYISLQKWAKRSIQEPVVEPAIRGPKEGFTEDLLTNLSLIRKRLKTSKLKFEEIKIGSVSKTTIVIAYLQGIAAEATIAEVRKRISKIKDDAILESGSLEEFIEDSPSSIFPQIANTERPDRLVSSLLEGQIGIIIDNNPFVLVAPQTLTQMLQAPDDYYERYVGATFIRLIRYLFYGMALTLPSLYIAFSTFHQGMIPTGLLYSMAASRVNVPFPAVIEALIMELIFEGLREAGIRLPRTVGQSVSIVGGLVIGQAAVQAGIVSAPMVIIVSVTGIASFVFPKYNFALSIRILRFILMILAGTFGLFGMFVGIFAIMIHLSKLRSFGVPYLAPLGPMRLSSLKDVFVRAPKWATMDQSEFVAEQNKQQAGNQKNSGPKS